jgi:acetylornithine deacetylase/succinyl-diaminopimelate desuccinylase family protein
MTRESGPGAGGAIEEVLREIGEQTVAELLSDLVRIPSHQSEAAVVDYLAERLSALGLASSTTLVEGETRKNLVVGWGEGPHSLIFNTHMDTVPPGRRELWSHDPWGAEVADGRLYGRGSADAKGCLAAMVAAFEALVRSGIEANGRLTLMAVACEETQGRGTRKEVEGGLRAEAAVVGEPTGLEVHVAHKGVIRLRISTHGRAAHASRPEEGVNAISGMAGLIGDLERLATEVAGVTNELLGHATLTVTRIEGGQADNVVPERCTIGVDRRLLPGEDPREARRRIESLAAAVCDRYPGLEVSNEMTHDLHPARTDGDSDIVHHALRSRTEVLGGPSEPQGFPACCDMVYLSEAGVPSVILGPGDLSQAHVVDEHVRLTEVLQAAEIYARLALGWLLR